MAASLLLGRLRCFRELSRNTRKRIDDMEMNPSKPGAQPEIQIGTEVASGDGPYLYLVLHGEFAIIDVKGAPGISVLAAAIDEHVYMAGAWLGERHVPRGTTLTLSGVTGETAPDKSAMENIFIAFDGVTSKADSAWMELRLPRPAAVFPYQQRKVPQNPITFNGPAGVTFLLPPAATPIAPVFQYVLTDANSAPFLHDIDGVKGMQKWDAGASYNRDGSYSLHVFAEIDSKPPDGTHAAMAFRMTAQLMGVDASLREIITAITGGPDPQGPPLVKAETAFRLYDRVNALGGLGAKQRNDIDFPKSLDPPPSQSVDEASCGPVLGLRGYRQ
jgi:hypothetical protein